MAIIDLSETNYNGVIKDSVVMSKGIKHTNKVSFVKEYPAVGRGVKEVSVKDGDYLFLGNFPKSSILTSVKVLVREPMNTDVTMDLYHTNVYDPTTANAIRTGIVLDKDVSILDVFIGIDSGVVKDDGVTPADVGSVWVGSDVYFFAQINGADLTQGDIEIVCELQQFDSNGELDNLS